MSVDQRPSVHQDSGAPSLCLRELEQLTRAEISSGDAKLLDSFPPDTYLGFFRSLPAYCSYRYVPPDAERFCEAITANAGPDVLEAYHRLAVIRLVDDATAASRKLTPELITLKQSYLQRVIAQAASPRKGFYLHQNDQFAKDFAVCRGKLLPCGVELLDPRSGVPRRTLFSGGVSQLFSAAGFFARRTRDFRPFYELHFDRRSINRFNEAGYTELYLRIAELLALEPGVMGVMSSSWWHDPNLAEISPELAFIDHHPKSAGARLFAVGEDETASADATRFSRHRQTLHAKGLYRPRVYLLVWARQDILAWARDHRPPFTR